MPATLYVLQSQKDGRRYIGVTDDVKVRLLRHNGGFVKSTRSFRPWELVYTEMHQSKDSARYRERILKKSAQQRRKLFNKFPPDGRGV